MIGEAWSGVEWSGGAKEFIVLFFNDIAMYGFFFSSVQLAT